MEIARVIEIAHILSGPVLGILVTALAFNDDALIHSKLEVFFRDKNTDQELAQNTRDMMAGAIAFATFLGNAYLVVFNCVIAFIIYPAHYLRIVTIISLSAAACVLLQAGYLIWRHGVLSLGEESAPLPWNTKMLYPKFLRWEQLILSIAMVLYFAIGIWLNPNLSGFNMEVPNHI